MEATALSVGKSVLEGALGYAKSAVAEEVALQLGVRRDHGFIRDELEMMLAFLMAAHEERDEHKVVKTWVKQVRDVAYDVEDSLQDFAVRLRKKPSWRRILCMLVDRHNLAKQMRELRAKVEDVSQRNVRYRLIKGSDTKPATSTGQSSMTGETMSGMEEATRQMDKAKVDLIRLIKEKDENLRVIAVWGTSWFMQKETSIVKIAYDALKGSKMFECLALVKIMHPFNQTEFLQNIVRQFYLDSLEEAATTEQISTPGVQDLRRMGMLNNQSDLVHAFKKYVNDKSYLIILDDLSTIEEWDQIKACFPSNKKGSRLIVCAKQVEIASLCVGPEPVVPEHKQLSSNQAIFVFYEKVSQGRPELTEESEDDPCNSNVTDTVNTSDEKGLPCMEKIMVAAFRESQLIGRENEKSELIKMISNKHSQDFDVISICGMGGIGKTSLVKYVYQSQELNPMFDKRACVTIKRPFNPKELLNSLATQLDDHEKVTGDELAVFLKGKRYLIVLDDISSTAEWDAIEENFPRTDTMSRILVTTRMYNVAKHCSKESRNICKLNFLGDKDAYDLFTEKVFGNICLDEQYPELADEAKLLLKKCKGLPLAIVTIGGFLAKQPKTRMEWRKLNEHISAELEMNPELEMIKNILIKSYDGLPYHLKSCFLYLSIFPEDSNISRRRLVHRWIAEGYPSEVRVKSMTEKADIHFMELIERGMILPSQQSVLSRKKIDNCKVHDLMREISISKSTEENLVLRIEEGCSLNTHEKVRHLTISSNWERDQGEFDSIEDLSHIRSLTVFGKWRPFFISDKMCLLRVLDLENTENLLDHHLQQIGKLLHLKYLSLRGCNGIHHLPDSIGNLKQLLTLDIRNTSIIKLPKNIIKLKKLQYIYAGNRRSTESYDEIANNVPKLMQNNKPCLLALVSVLFCAAYCAPHVMEEDGINRRDVRNAFCSFIFPMIIRELNSCGVVLPRGFRKLRALHTLSVVNIAGGKGILLEIKKLTQLRRLAVSGINEKNHQEVFSVLSGLSCLESLSLYGMWNLDLRACLNRVPPPPDKLQSLTLSGNLLKLPEWVKGLKHLTKLKLEGTKLAELDDTMLTIGKLLPNLAILGLLQDSLLLEREHCLTFRPEAFQNLMVLQVSCIHNLISVEFEGRATPKLEVLRFGDSLRSISGLSSLPNLKEVLIEDHGYIHLMTDVRTQLSKNPKKPVLKTIVN